MIHCIGDPHGMTETFDVICERLRFENPGTTIIGLGDMGIGFKDDHPSPPPTPSPDVLWISGNHDDHKACIGLPGYLGDFGVRKIDGKKVFWMRGAFSTDVKPMPETYGRKEWKGRTEGVDWWPYEELSMEELAEAIALYDAERPDIVITHDCPNEVREEWFGVTSDESSRTSQALSMMFRSHQPKVWAFGHWHAQKFSPIGNTMFVCCGELQTKRIWPPPKLKVKKRRRTEEP